MVRQTARRFAEERVAPLIRDCFRDARFPSELIPEMAELGFLGANLEGYGCAGMSNVEYGLVMQEIERVDSGLRSFRLGAGCAGDVPHPDLWVGGAEAEVGCRAWQSGKAVGCFWPDRARFRFQPRRHAGPTARRDGAEWVLNGEKTWITNGSAADIAVIWARADDGVVYGYLVERGTPGYTTSDIHGKWSMRASVTSSLSFADCRVKEKRDRLPAAKGLKGPLACASQARYGIGWGTSLAPAMDCYETARQYTIIRKQFGGPADRIPHQLVQEKAGRDDHRDHQGVHHYWRYRRRGD